MLRAVLFDLDDTLVDQESAASAAVVPWARDHGVTDGDVSRRWSAISQVHYSRCQRRELTFAQQRRERVRERLAAEVDDDTADELFDGYLRRYEAGWQVFADAVPALRRARTAGLTVAVLPAGKPDPRALAHALDLVGVAAGSALVGPRLRGTSRRLIERGLRDRPVGRETDLQPAWHGLLDRARAPPASRSAQKWSGRESRNSRR